MLRYEKPDLTERVLVALVCALCTLCFYLWEDPTSDSVGEQYRPPTYRKHDHSTKESFHHKISADDTFLPQSDAPGLALNGADGIHDIPVPSAKFTQSARDLPFAFYDPSSEGSRQDLEAEWHGAHVSCEGPRGVDVNGNQDDMLGAYKLSVHVTLPNPIFGSYEETGLGSGYCFTRRARNRAYGDEDLPSNGPHPVPPPRAVDWEHVNWGRLQQQCYARNRDRFEDSVEPCTPMFRFPTKEDIQGVDDTLVLPQPEPARQKAADSKKYKKRNAVLLRTDDTKNYTPDTMIHK
ncbi:MAG: hypothetical protein Q9168_002406 [Polycauliona sp. 1 TL-2023]